jgi:hypothetical protein
MASRPPRGAGVCMAAEDRVSRHGKPIVPHRANQTSFRVGHAGGPGRPRGSRAKLSELATEMLRTDFEQYGAEVIQHVREKKPEVYLASIVSLLPKQSQIEKRSPFDDLTDAELDQLDEYIAQMQVKTVAQLELVANSESAAEPVKTSVDD